MTDQSDKKLTLRDRIRSMLTVEFDRLAPDEVAQVLSGLATELKQMSEAGIHAISEISESSQGWGERLTEHRFTAIPPEDAGSQALYGLTAESDEDIRGVLEQALEVGAVLLEVKDQPPALNAFVDLSLNFPTLHLHIQTSGRVVHVSARGVAVELSGLSREDRASLEELHADFATREEQAREIVVPSDDRTPLPPRERETPPPAVQRPGGRERSPASSTAPVAGRPSDSVAVPSLSTRRGSATFRRQVELTAPDVRVLDSSQVRRGAGTREFYGPELPWIEPMGDPDRVEALADERIIDVLLQLSQDGLTGLVEVDSGQNCRQLLFDGGFVVEIAQRPRDADEELGLMLFRADRITKQQLLMAAAHADENQGVLARSLLDLDILDSEQIRQAIAGRLTYLMREICDVTSGEVRVFGAQSLPAGFLPMPPLRVHVAVERVVFRRFFEHFKQVPLREREKQVGDRLETYPEIAAPDFARVERAVVDPEHAALTDRIAHGRRRLQEVFTESSLSHGDTFAVVQALHRMGLLRFDRSLHQTIVRERYRENVTVKYLSVHKASYFEVLNVHWSSYSEVVQKAYEELILQFDPDDVPENLEAEVHQRVTEIRDRIESAYQVLAERETRHAYRKRIMPEYKLAHAIPLFMKQGELAERRRNWPEAVDAIQRVLEIEPDHRPAKIRLDRLQMILDNRLSPDAADSNF